MISVSGAKPVKCVDSRFAVSFDFLGRKTSSTVGLFQS